MFHVFYILSILFLIWVIPSIIYDKRPDQLISDTFVYLLFSTISTLFQTICLTTGINLNLKSKKAKKSIINYSTCTESEKLSIEFKTDYCFFYVKELAKPLRLTLLFLRNTHNLLITAAILMLWLLFLLLILFQWLNLSH